MGALLAQAEGNVFESNLFVFDALGKFTLREHAASIEGPILTAFNPKYAVFICL